jgi:hypothetical protein
LAQIYVRNPGRPKAALRFRSAWWIDALVFVAFIGLAYGVVNAALTCGVLELAGNFFGGRLV